MIGNDTDIYSNKSVLLNGFEYNENDHKKYVVSLRQTDNNDPWIELRTWVNYGNNKDYIPTRQGIYMSLKGFKDKFIVNANKLLQEYDQKV